MATMLLKAGTQYAIRNTQYANPVKLFCVIRKRLPQYAIAQNAAYGVPLISQQPTRFCAFACASLFTLWLKINLHTSSSSWLHTRTAAGPPQERRGLLVQGRARDRHRRAPRAGGQALQNECPQSIRCRTAQTATEQHGHVS
jgi:hypothetical protein